jgi:putative DNA primase/helicase
MSDADRTEPHGPEFTPTHIWRSKDGDYPCIPTGQEEVGSDGRVYALVRHRDGDEIKQIGIPLDELLTNEAAQPNGGGAPHSDAPKSNPARKAKTQRQPKSQGKSRKQPKQKRKTAGAKQGNGAAPAGVIKAERDAAIERLVAINDDGKFEDELLNAVSIVKGHVGAIRKRRTARKNAKTIDPAAVQAAVAQLADPDVKLYLSDCKDEAKRLGISPTELLKRIEAECDRLRKEKQEKEAKERELGLRDKPPPKPDPRPVISLRAGEMRDHAIAAEAHIAAAHGAMFQRGIELVRPAAWDVPASGGRTTLATGLLRLSPYAMLDLLAEHIVFLRFDGRSQSETPADPPYDLAQLILARAGQWRVPHIAGVVTIPTLRPDGSLLTAPGYDPATRLYHASDPRLTLPPIPQRPTIDDARYAVTLLCSLLDEFPFEGDVDKAVALSGLITPVVRGALVVAPLHAVRATTAGTGKSYLVDIASAITTGRPCPATSLAPRIEETESRICGLLLGGFPMVSIDNVNGDLGGDLLCQAVERPIVRVRRLGASDMFDIESRATWFATGNGMAIKGDMTRRTIRCSLDAGLERPELREFGHRPVADVMADRGRFIAACLIIVRSYLEAGSPDVLPPLQSFEDWSNLVRSALVWLGCGDPCGAMDAIAALDPEVEQLRELQQTWHDHIGSDPYTLKDLVDEVAGSTAPTAQPLRDALRRFHNKVGQVDTTALGKEIKRYEARIVAGYSFRRGDPDPHRKVATWFVKHT